MKCKYCGAEFDGGSYCPVCGSNNDAYVEEEKVKEPEDVFEEKKEEPAKESTDTRPKKSKIAAALLAILFGGIGVQFFYLNRFGAGICSILFCWTGIPAIVGVIHGIIMITEDTETFENTYKVKCTD